MTPYPHIRKSLFILFFVLAFGTLPTLALADVSQLTNSDDSANIQGGSIGQTLGTGLSGTLTQLDLYINDQSSPFSDYINVTLCGYTLESDYDSSGNCNGTFATTTSITLSYSSGGGNPKLASNSTLSFTLDPSLFYVLSQTGNYGGSATIYMRGSDDPDTYSGGECQGAQCTGIADWYFVMSGVSGPSGSDDDGTTHIESVDPPNKSTISTSSIQYDFRVVGFVETDDYSSGTRIMLKADRNTDQQAVGALTGFNSAFGNKTYFPIGASGDFDVGTTSDKLKLDLPLRVGLYRTRYEIQSPKFNIFGFGLFYSTLYATSTSFTVGTTTGVDNIQIDQENYLQAITDNTLGSDPLADCQFSLFDSALDFSLGGKVLKCIGGVAQWLIIPPSGVLDTTITQLKDGFLTRVPIGYFTRIVDAISGGTAGTLPHLHADIPVIGGGDDILSIDFDLDEMITDGAALQDSFETPDHKSAKTIIEPIIQLIIGLLVLMFIYNDLHSYMKRL